MAGPAGFLNINKASGWTSTDVVRRVKRLTGAKKVGHGGTLDPLASGVLPVCIGAATRFAESILMGTKEYLLTVRLGAATDTYDSEGVVVSEADASGITEREVRDVLPRFMGETQQVPPMYSAVKHKGQRLYALARSGVEVERKSRTVSVYSLSLRRWAPPEFDVQVECGHGFYARSLAYDLGIALGNAAHMSGLVRTRAGRFRIEDASTIEEIQAAAEAGNWTDLLLPLDYTLDYMPAVILDPLQAGMVRHGQSLPVGAFGGPALSVASGEKVRAYDRDENLVAILVYEPQRLGWRPERVIAGS